MANRRTLRLVQDLADDAPRPSLYARARKAVEAFRAYQLPPLTSSSPELARYFGGGIETSAGLAVSEYTAMNLSAVWAAVNRIAGDIASLPLELFQHVDGNDRQAFLRHPLYYLLHDQPNPEMSSVIWRQTMQAHALVWGNGYSEIVRDAANRPIELWPITPDRVVPFRQGVGAPLQYRVLNQVGNEVVLDASNMLHLAGLGFDGVLGYSVIQHARESLGLGMATEKFGGTFFGNGASFGGVISYAGSRATDGSAENLRDQINKRHQGSDRAHKFLMLYNGATYQRIGIPPDDAQFLQTRHFQIAEICRWFNLPQHKLQELEKSTHANIEQQEIDYFSGSLGPWLQRWEQELTIKLIADSEYLQQFIEHNLDARMRGDSAARAELYSKLFSVGATTPNQIAARENLPSLKGGDRAFVPLNMIPLDRVDEYVDSLVAKAKPPQPTATPETPPGPHAPPDAAMNREIERLTLELADARRVSQEREDAKDVAVAELVAARTAFEAEHAERVAVGAELAAAAVALGTAREERLSVAEARATIASELESARAHGIAQAAEIVAQAGELAAVEARGVALVERLGQMTAELNHAEAARVAAVEALHELEGVEVARAEAMPRALRAVFEDAMSRMVRRELAKAKQFRATPEKLRAWRDTFDDATERAIFVEALRPALRAMHAWSGGEADADATATAIVDDYFAQSARAFDGVIAAGPEGFAELTQRTFTRWETERAGRVADLVEARMYGA